MTDHQPSIEQRLLDADIGWSGDAACVDAETAAEGAAAITALKARIQELEAELAGCRACRDKIDCISRGEAFQSPSRRYERPRS